MCYCYDRYNYEEVYEVLSDLETKYFSGWAEVQARHSGVKEDDIKEMFGSY